MSKYEYESFVECKNCGCKYRSILDVCPNCGTGKKKQSYIPLILIVILMFAITFVIVYFITNRKVKEEPQEIASLPTYENVNSMYYSQLNEKEADIYNQLYNMCLNYETSFVPVNSDLYTVRRAIEAFRCEWPEYFWVSSSFNYTHKGDEVVNVEFNVETNDIKKEYEEINSYVEEFISEIVDFPDEEQVKYIHDKMCDEFFYDKNYEECQDISSMVYKQKGVCAGYALFFELAMKKLGIECYYVNGDGINKDGVIPHAWDIVKVDDIYYWIDVTWDDFDYQGIATDYYYLQEANEDFKDHTIKNDFSFEIPN